ncbi:MAG: GNAT family N-acetyltransferase [Clostridiaceae bacterium]|nr:GNAT family N-acetyltransferase [Clostridiaceae bacterium]MBW4860142.1 GNAT family N-acetyltransferase [Clostridiaceae bacterium]MBW4869119.1 GNAT family N-acetyltransferase [Clostridiaceae bacterium]
MIRECTNSDLDQMVELAFQLNNQIDHYSAFCPISRKSIRMEFETAIDSKQHMIVGSFRDNKLTGLLNCYFDIEKKNADCSGPFIDSTTEDYLSFAKQLFDFINRHVDVEMKYTFFFSKENMECRNFLESINADRKVNEYELLLKKESFMPYPNTVEINNLNETYYNQFIQLHDFIFPNIYVSGKDIVEDINKNRFVFSIIDDNKLIAYSVLRLYKNSKIATAEIIGVDEKYRGKGYGKAILNHLLEFSFQKNVIEEIELIVDGDNDTAISLYQSLGFIIKAENCCYIAK